MSGAIAEIFALGTMVVLAEALIFIIIQLLSFFAAGKITGSFNDEFSSAFTLLGVLIPLSIVSTLIHTLLNFFLPSSLLPVIVSSVLFVSMVLIAVIKIYDLSVGKAILHLFLSFLIIAIASGLLIYGAIRLLPLAGLQSNLNFDILEKAGPTETESVTTLPETTDTGTVTEMTVPATIEPAPDGSGPKLPGTAVGSHTSCQSLTDCTDANELCFDGICQLKSEILSYFPATENCTAILCENCDNSGNSLFSVNIGTSTIPLQFCAECNEDSIIFSCKEGFTCENYKCVAVQAVQ